MIQPQQGQSNYDLILQVVGGFDTFISYLSSNSLPLSSVPQLILFLLIKIIFSQGR